MTIIVTGGAGFIGSNFVFHMLKKYPDYRIICLDKLTYAGNLSTLTPVMDNPNFRFIKADICDRDAVFQLFEEEKPNVALLINCSGFGKFCATMETPVEVNLNMIDLNCAAVVAMCQTSIPYMQNGAKIINIASVAAYQPIPYINVYGATKSFVLHFSRALNRELKKDGISVTAVCPFWTKTEFFNRSIDKEKNPVVKKYVAMYTPEQIVGQAWKDVKNGKEVSMYGFTARTQTLLAKLLPHGFVMSYWINQQKLK